MDVLILSENLLMARAIEIECKNMGLHCGIGTTMRQSIPSIVTIIDLDTLEMSNVLKDTIVIGISSENDNIAESMKRNCSIIFHRPFSMSSFRNEISKYFNVGSFRDTVVLQSQELQCNWDQVHLTPNETIIVEKLLKANNEVVPSETLMQCIGENCDKNVLRVHISDVNKKLQLMSNSPKIKNKKGKGYYLLWEK